MASLVTAWLIVLGGERTMLDRKTFDRVKEKHSGYASWAVWAAPAGKPKSNMGDLSLLDPDRNPDLLETLRNDIVMMGLNLSRSFPSQPWGNFHDAAPHGQDYKLRFALAGTPYWGAYMTDFVKGVVMLKEYALMKYVAENERVIADSVGCLMEEFDDLKCAWPTVITFGHAAHMLAAKYLPISRYARLVRVTHYSQYISKEDYRVSVLAEVGAEIPGRKDR